MLKKVLIIKIILVCLCMVLGAVSFFIIGDKLGSADFHSKTIAALDNSRNRVMELTAASIASSSAITLLPGDVGTPIAQELADMGKYFMIVLCAIYLEKFLLTITGFAAFKFIVPIACFLLTIFIVSNAKTFAKIAAKLFLFSIVISFTIPVSVNIARLIENNYSATVQSTLDKAKEDTETVRESAKEANGDSNMFEKIINNISGNVNELLKKFENTLSSFIEAVAVLIVTSCLIPVGVLLFLVWFIKLIFSLDLTGIKIIERTKQQR